MRKQWVGIFIGIMVLLGSGGCDWQASATQAPPAKTVASVNNTKPTVTPTPLATTTVAADNTPAALAPEAAEAARAQVLQALRAASQASSFRAQLATDLAGEKDQLTLEFVAPDRYRMKGENLEFLIIGNAGFISFGANRWQHAPRDESNARTLFDVGETPIFWGAKENDEARAALTVTQVAADTCGEAAAQRYDYELHNAFGRTGTTFLQTWVSKATGLPCKSALLTERNGTKAYATLTWQAYDVAELAIAPPAAEQIKTR